MKKKSKSFFEASGRLNFYIIVACLALLPACLSGNLMAGEKDMLRLYTGSYATADEEGIKCYEFNPRSGAVSYVSGFSGIENPSFLALHSSGEFLYAVSETDRKEGNLSGGVASFRITSSGGLVKLNEVPSGGAAPCHIALDRTEQVLMAANYNGGNVSIFPLMADGSLGPMSCLRQHSGSGVNPARQKGPHAHSINPSPDNRFALAADLGLDKVFVYRLDTEAGRLEVNTPAFARVSPGSGPRHLAFHPTRSVVYVINEIASTVTVFRYQPDEGALMEIQSVSTLPEGFQDRNSTAEVVVSPDGKYLYGSNRGHDSIAVFVIDQDSGKLEPVQHRPTGGRTPRNFCLSPDGGYLLAANQRSGNMVVFPLDQATGKLLDPVDEVSLQAPVCIKFVK